MNKIKLIALDMDGTLLNSKKECTEHTKQTLKKAQDMGVAIVPATGRAFNGMPDIFRELNVKYGIFCNGASCYDVQNETLIASTHFTVDEAIKLLHMGDKYDASHDVYVGGCGYCEAKYLDVFETYCDDAHIQQLIRKTRKRLDGSLDDFLMEKNMGVEKVNLFFRDLEEREQARTEYEATGMTIPVSAIDNNLELGKLGASKGNAVLQLAKHLGIKPEEVMTCGDAGNDLSMIEAAGLGVAMGNATQEVKDIANYITATNDEDGVAKAIEKFVFV